MWTLSGRMWFLKRSLEHHDVVEGERAADECAHLLSLFWLVQPPEWACPCVGGSPHASSRTQPWNAKRGRPSGAGATDRVHPRQACRPRDSASGAPPTLVGRERPREPPLTSSDAQRMNCARGRIPSSSLELGRIRSMRRSGGGQSRACCPSYLMRALSSRSSTRPRAVRAAWPSERQGSHTARRPTGRLGFLPFADRHCPRRGADP